MIPDNKKENTEKENNEEIVPVNEVITFTRDIGELTFNSDKEVDDFIARVERRNMAIEKITNAALKRLMPTDFVDFSGKPYLQGVAAERLKKYFGIQVTDVERIPAKGYDVVEEDTAVRLRVTYQANYRLGDMVQVGVGVRDTHNKFLCKTGDDYKELADINLPNLDQSARTAMERDGISRLLGMRGLTWEYLKEIGFTADKTARVSFAKGSEGGNATSGDSDAQGKQAEMRDMLLAMAGNDTTVAGEILVNYTKSEDGKYKGYRNVTKLNAAQTNIYYPKIKKDYDAFMAKQSKNIADMEDGQEAELGF
jgi:hypothetical protein